MTDDLVSWLRDQVYEDERVAREAIGNFRHDAVVSNEVHVYLNRWDPVRVLAEVQAKRRIIDEHHLWTGVQSDAGSYCSICVGYPIERHEGGHIGVSWPCPTLRLLALPYAGHESYRAEWAPDTEVNRG